MASPSRLALCSALATLCAASPLRAQEAASTPDASATPAAVTPLDAVTTTGTRTPTVSGDSAVPVSVMRRDEILERDQRSVSDTIRDIPGVEIEGTPRTTAMEPSIRGFSGDRIVFRLDGARNNFNAGHRGRLFIDPNMLREIDVRRGPGSTLCGSVAIGGVVAMRTIEPDDIILPGSELPIGGFLRGGYQSNGSMWRGIAAAPVRVEEYPMLDAAALAAARRWAFGPARHAGHPVPAWVEVPVHFRLN